MTKNKQITKIDNKEILHDIFNTFVIALIILGGSIVLIELLVRTARMFM